MKICKIFYSCLAIGIGFGIAIMMLANGLLGHAQLGEAYVVFFIVGGISGWGLYRVVKRLKIMWTVTVVFPPPKDSVIKVQC